MKILGIETSCDETSAAVLEIHPAKSSIKNRGVSGKKQFNRIKNGNFDLLSHVVLSQEKIHAKFGGIVPEVAARKQMEMIIPVIEQALKKAKTNLKKIDALAVTYGPGLITSLTVGVETAKTLAKILNKKLVAVNHLAGHLLVNHLIQPAFAQSTKKINRPNWTTAGKQNSWAQVSQPAPTKKIKYPAVGLIVSGGHTFLVLIKNESNYKIIGETQDDAVGEAFDKVAKILNLGYPGGPIISKLAKKGQIGKFDLPRPMISQQNFNFSFAGLKTAMLYLFHPVPSADRAKQGQVEGSLPAGRHGHGLQNKNKQAVYNICAEFQQACIDVLVSKTLRAIKKHKPQSFLLGGGVAANSELRKQLQQKISKKYPDIKIFMPELKFTGDNAAMIAVAGYFKLKNKQYLSKDKIDNLTANPNLRLK